MPALHSYIRYARIPFAKAAIWASVVQRLDGLERHVSASMKWGAQLEVDTRDVCGRKMYFFGVWEPNLTAFLDHRLRDGDAFIDVGANVGYFSALAAKLVGHGSVVAVEAITRTYDVLVRNMKRNALSNVRCINLAASDRHEKLLFFTSGDVVLGTSTTSESFAKRHGHGERTCAVDSAPLSSMLTPNEINCARIVKIDVEGAEAKAIFGLEQLMQSGRPDLEFAIEIQAASFDLAISYFAQRGFNAYHMPNDYSVEAYITPQPVAELVRITAFPSHLKDIDLIFSRIDAPSLRV